MMKKIKPKETHLILSFVLGAMIFTVLLALGMEGIILNPQGLASTLLTTAGIFIGFTIAALGIYHSISLKPEIRLALVQQGYYQQLNRNFFISVVMFIAVIIDAIVAICVYSVDTRLLFQHILNTIMISVFCSAMVLLVCANINFFKIVSKN